MRHDARNLADFYESPLGLVTRRHIARRIALAWPLVKGLRILGAGFAVPYLRPYMNHAERVIAAMPAQGGVIIWPPENVSSVLVEDEALPFPDAFFDRIMVVHGLERADASRAYLRQLWNVLAPEGELLLVAPNRASLWSQVELSPFAEGRPFSRHELDSLLAESLFAPDHWDRALYAPPLRSRRFVKTGQAWERMGHRFWPQLGGVHIVRAKKTMYAPSQVAKKVKRDGLLAPQPTAPAV
jgi:SAM-dependent methyltransferase